jgi:hypothetical protein
MYNRSFDASCSKCGERPGTAPESCDRCALVAKRVANARHRVTLAIIKFGSVAAQELTMPCRSQLRDMERDGIICFDHQTGRWVIVPMENNNG